MRFQAKSTEQNCDRSAQCEAQGRQERESYGVVISSYSVPISRESTTIGISLCELNRVGTYVAVEPYHIDHYLDEQMFRFNNRIGHTGGTRFLIPKFPYWALLVWTVSWRLAQW
jgi:hypothetical protein